MAGNPYIEINLAMIPNYGEKWRYSETITTAFVESTVNDVVAKRMVKKQQMQWSPEGAPADSDSNLERGAKPVFPTVVSGISGS